MDLGVGSPKREEKKGREGKQNVNSGNGLGRSGNLPERGDRNILVGDRTTGPS